MESPELVEAFAAAWEAGRGHDVPLGIGPRLAALCAEARSRFPELTLDDRALAEAIGRRAPLDGAQAYVDRCRGDELALALAAARGDPAAIARFERTYRTAIDATCRRFATATETIDDLRQALRERLLVGARPKLLEYAGQGLLDSWLRVTAIRLFLDLAKRKDRAREYIARDDEPPVLPDPSDLGLELIKLEYRTAVRDAMYEAARELEPGDRHLLRLAFVSGLGIDQLGVALGVHRATAARRLARARDELVAGTRAVLRQRLAASTADLDEVLGLVMSRLDVSMSKLLASSDRSPGR